MDLAGQNAPMHDPEPPTQIDREPWQTDHPKAGRTWNAEELASLEQQLAELGERLPASSSFSSTDRSALAELQPHRTEVKHLQDASDSHESRLQSLLEEEKIVKARVLQAQIDGQSTAEDVAKLRRMHSQIEYVCKLAATSRHVNAPPSHVKEKRKSELDQLPQPDVKPSARPARAVTALADQLQHESAGVRKSAARSLGRLAEAALRRGLSEVTLEHAGVLANMHLDTNADVREVASSVLAQVQRAAEEQPSGAAINAMLSEQLSSHIGIRYYRDPAREPAHAELPTTPAKRSGSGSVGKFPDSHSCLRKALSETSLHPHRVAAQKHLRPKHMSRQAAQRARALDKEEAKQDIRELLHQLHKPASAVEEQQEAQRLAKQLEDPDAGLRASAAMALGHMNQAARPYVGLLMERLTDRDSFVRAAAAVALGKLPKPPPPPRAKTRPKSRSPSRRRKVKNSRSASSEPRRPSLSGGALGPNSLARADSVRPVGRFSPQSGEKSRPSSAPRIRGMFRPGMVRHGHGQTDTSSCKVAWSDLASAASANCSLSQLSFEKTANLSCISKQSSTATLLGPSSVDRIVIRCCCGLAAARRQAKNGGPNEGRFFYCCPQEKGQQCQLLVWEPD